MSARRVVAWCGSHPRTVTVVTLTLAGVVTVGAARVVVLLAVSALCIWWGLTRIPEAIGWVAGRPVSAPLPLGPVPAGQSCPACGRSHTGRDVLIGIAGDGSRSCVEITPRQEAA